MGQAVKQVTVAAREADGDTVSFAKGQDRPGADNDNDLVGDDMPGGVISFNAGAFDFEAARVDDFTGLRYFLLTVTISSTGASDVEKSVTRDIRIYIQDVPEAEVTPIAGGGSLFQVDPDPTARDAAPVVAGFVDGQDRIGLAGNGDIYVQGAAAAGERDLVLRSSGDADATDNILGVIADFTGTLDQLDMADGTVFHEIV